MTPTEGSPEAVALRPAVASDVGSMAAVHVAARRAGQMPDSPWDVDELARRLAERLAPDEAWVAEADGQVVAYVRLVRPDHERVAWVDDLYVHPRAQGCGVGNALLEVVRSRLPGGFGLWVFTDNHPARRFYAAQGLVEVEWTTGEDNPDGVPEVRMQWCPDRSTS